jgi:predicted metal-dependent HD superfamily phosphohydrolase
MKVFKKEQKALYKSYKKRLTDLHEKLLQGTATPVEYFVTYLMMLRDKQLLSVPFNQELDLKDIDLASIITALKEYDKYKKCIYDYYAVKNGVVKRIAEGTEQEVQEKYTKERLYHWETFWNLVKMCAEDWSPSA